MTGTRKLAGAAVIALALSLLNLPGAALAHGETGDHVAEFRQHMPEYAANIHHLIATVNRIVANYEPGAQYAEATDALVEQWETVKFHQAVEVKATPLYPPIWAAIGAFATALDKGASPATVEARADAIAAALWQGYGALKLLAVRGASDHAHEHEHRRAGGAAVIDTINSNLDRVLVLYKNGASEKARALIFDTYMNHFEGIEGDLIEQDAELVADLEADFNATLPRLIKNAAPASKVAAQIDAMQHDLARARTLLAQAEQEETPVF